MEDRVFENRGASHALSLCALGALLGLGCEGGAGHPSPPLAELTEIAVAKERPEAGVAPYVRPEPIVVPLVAPPPLEVFPKDEQGRAILVEEAGVRLVVDTERRDAITAMSTCANRVAACVEPSDREGGRSIDACWAYAPRCVTSAPWNEASCCPLRCAELYQALRRRGYSERRASFLTLDSECFNGLRELLAESGAR